MNKRLTAVAVAALTLGALISSVVAAPNHGKKAPAKHGAMHHAAIKKVAANAAAAPDPCRMAHPAALKAPAKKMAKHGHKMAGKKMAGRASAKKA